EAERAAGLISLYEGGQALTSIDLKRASEGIQKRAALAQMIRAEDLTAAQTAAERFKSNLREAVDTCQGDAVITPTWPFAAPLISAETVPVNGREVPVDPHRSCFVRAGNAVDACAITLPIGIYPHERVPAGVQLMAPGGRELRLLATALSVEAALPPPPRAPVLAAYLSSPASR
ncbi:MAG: amidase family protein, partial [Acidobacteriota bacterium]